MSRQLRIQEIKKENINTVPGTVGDWVLASRI